MTWSGGHVNMGLRNSKISTLEKLRGGETESNVEETPRKAMCTDFTNVSDGLVLWWVTKATKTQSRPV